MNIKQAKSKKLIQLLIRLWRMQNQKRKKQIYILIIIMFISSLSEVVSLASVIPLLQVLANPEYLWSQPFIQQYSHLIGIRNYDQLLLPCCLLFSATAILSGLIRLFNIYLNGRISASVGSDLSLESLRRTLYQPYAFHISKNSSKSINSIKDDIANVISLVLNPLLQLISSFVISFSIIVTLLVINWQSAIFAALFILIIYYLAIANGRKPLQRMSRKQVDYRIRQIKSIQESLGAIRDIILNNTQLHYTSSYEKVDRRLRISEVNSRFISLYPRMLLEPISMVIIAFIAYYLSLEGGLDKTLPILGALALGAQRLLPNSQKVYEGWAQCNSAITSLENVINLIEKPITSQSLIIKRNQLHLKDKIIFKNVSYQYEKNLSNVIRSFNLSIQEGERLGIIGRTGSGKSTFIDLLIGLLKPTNGQIIVDGKDIHSQSDKSFLYQWRSIIAHVPQDIFLTDSSIAENIALGVAFDSIDLEKATLAAKKAQLHDFIISTPQGYKTIVGERGVSLSGGQRQRIGIARALYKNAQIIVFDEATSSLDNLTEKSLMHAIDSLSRKFTIIQIAHRLSSVENCDRVIRIEKGTVHSEGPPETMLS
ncbi:ABC transporter ATP-binding protein [Prochlorococcus marinus]|uniref:ABC transporter ATP-binding protein n=1 Tax=Prochlorococcus marinus TaxID=1219 RepID=UPI0022B33D48|nr:ABC transporter ATP-binding protein [Prochlorococcus marinus]